MRITAPLTPCLASCAAKRLLLAVCMAAGWSSALLADNAPVQVSLNETGVWDSNPMMRSRDVKAIAGSLTTARLDFIDKQEVYSVGVRGSIDHGQYDRSEFNSTDYHLGVDLKRRTQRAEFGLGASSDYDTTRTSEITTLGTETGTVRHWGYAAAPSVAYNLTQLSRVELGGQYAKSLYEDRRYTDYHTISFTPTYVYQLSPVYSALFVTNLRRYQTDNNTSRRVDSVGPSVGVGASFSEDFTARLWAGREMSRDMMRGEVIQDWDWSSTFSGELAYKDEQDRVQFSASRVQQALGNGNSELMTTLNLKESHQVSQSFAVDVGGSYQFADQSARTFSDLDYQYSGNAGLQYQATQTFGFTASYLYRNKTFANTGVKAEENMVRVGLAYRPQLDF